MLKRFIYKTKWQYLKILPFLSTLTIMKFKILLILLSINLLGFTQVSVSKSHVGKRKIFTKGTFEKLKKTTTIFVLSNIYEKEEYEKM